MKVNHNVREHILQVARQVGVQRASDQETLENLFQAKFSEGLKTVGKNMNFVDLYQERQKFKDAIIEVIDTGMGMTEEGMQRAFTVYYSTKADGTGLGLPMVRRIIERHGGRIQIESRPNEGATFVIELPLVAPEEFLDGESD